MIDALNALRFAWAESDSSFPFNTSVFRNSHPLIETLSSLLAQRQGIFQPPQKTAVPLLPFAQSCELALLLGPDGEWLGRQLLRLRQFPTLWSAEKTYQEKQTEYLLHLVLKSFGRESALPESENPYFKALSQRLPSWKEIPAEEAWGAKIHSEGDFEIALVSFGSQKVWTDHFPLGAIRAGGIEIPSFGPQVYPLVDATLFGIDLQQCHEDGAVYSRVAARPDVWLKARLSSVRNLEIQAYGLKVESPLAFTFYVKAAKAMVEGNSSPFLPKSLQRYVGAGRKVTFQKESSQLQIGCPMAHKMELIPLAGGGCFWNGDFLLAFDIPPHDGYAALSFETIH